MWIFHSHFGNIWIVMDFWWMNCSFTKKKTISTKSNSLHTNDLLSHQWTSSVCALTVRSSIFGNRPFHSLEKEEKPKRKIMMIVSNNRHPYNHTVFGIWSSYNKVGTIPIFMMISCNIVHLFNFFFYFINETS